MTQPDKTLTLEGSRLKTARRRRGLKHSEVARALDVPEKTVRAWEEKTEWCNDKEIILRLAWLLKFPAGFFTGPEIECLEVEDTSLQ